MILLQITQSPLPVTGNPKADWAIVALFAIAAIITVVSKILDWKKDKHIKATLQFTQDTLLENRKIAELIEKHLKVLADHYVEEVSDRQMNKLVDTGIEHLKLRIGVDVSKIMMHNNIRINPDIEKKVSAYVKNAFEYFELNMKMFRFKEVEICHYIPKSYLPHVLKYSVEIVMKPRISHDEGMADLTAITSYMITKFAKMKTEMYQNIYDCKKITKDC